MVKGTFFGTSVRAAFSNYRTIYRHYVVHSESQAPHYVELVVCCWHYAARWGP